MSVWRRSQMRDSSSAHLRDSSKRDQSVPLGEELMDIALNDGQLLCIDPAVPIGAEVESDESADPIRESDLPGPRPSARKELRP